MHILLDSGVSKRNFSKIFTENVDVLFALNNVASVTNLSDALFTNLLCIIPFSQTSLLKESLLT